MKKRTELLSSVIIFALVVCSIFFIAGCAQVSPTTTTGNLIVVLTQNITTESSNFRVIVYKDASVVASTEVSGISMNSSKEASFSLPNGIYTVEAFVDSNNNQTADDSEIYDKENSVTISGNNLSKSLAPNIQKTSWGTNKISGTIVGLSSYNMYVGLYTEDYLKNQNAVYQGQIVSSGKTLLSYSFKVKNGTYYIGAFSDVNGNGVLDSSDDYGVYNWDGNGTATSQAISVSGSDSTGKGFVIYVGKAPISNVVSWDKTTIEADLKDVISAGTSLALDSSGKAHVSYFDGNSATFKYASNSSGAWTKAVVDSTSFSGRKNSIAVDSLGKVHICYYDYSSGITEIKYATNAFGAWALITIDGSVGSTMDKTSIAAGPNGKIHISYYDSANGDLKYATNQSGAWVIDTVDSTGDVGRSSSIAVDSSNKVHISYYDATNGDLKYATNSSGAWVVSAVDAGGDVGSTTSIGIDSSDKCYIAYKDYTNKTLKYGTNKSGSWQTETVDPNPEAGGFCDIALDSSGYAHISYYYYNPDTVKGLLKYATNSSGSWTKSTVDDSTYNLYVPYVGTDNSIKISAGGKIYISYYYNPTLDGSKMMIAVSK